jgi:hypothetical protein
LALILVASHDIAFGHAPYRDDVCNHAVVKIIEKTFLFGAPHEEIEDLFSHLELIAPALASVGTLILAAGIMGKRNSKGQLP